MLVYLKKLLLFLLITIISTLVYIFTYHQVCLNSEQKLLDNPQGRLVQVGSKNMNVYVTGQGEKTLVFWRAVVQRPPFSTLRLFIQNWNKIIA